MSTLILPPRLNGNTRATLEIRVEALLLTSFSAKQKLGKNSAKVFLRWWGQALNEGLYFSPRVVQSLGLRRDESPSNRGIRVAVFKASNIVFSFQFDESKGIFMIIPFIRNYIFIKVHFMCRCELGLLLKLFYLYTYKEMYSRGISNSIFHHLNKNYPPSSYGLGILLSKRYLGNY
jgi:hypothetical protein